MLKPARFMRQPFFVTGYKVTSENMDEIAKWCEGHVIRDAERPFVRVPVIRTTNIKQTEAYEGTWVLVSKKNGRKTFKIYTEEYLRSSFFEVLDDEIEPSDLIQTPSPSSSEISNAISDLSNKESSRPKPSPPRINKVAAPPLATPFSVVEVRS